MPSTNVKPLLQGKKFRWLVTGAAGFIGSHITEALLDAGQEVVGFDNFSSGKRSNLDEARGALSSAAWDGFTLIEESIENPAALRKAIQGVDFVLHHAAFVSVPMSIKNPEATFRTNAQGFENVLAAAREANVQRVVYASSSAVYGSETSIPAREDRIGQPLSPYAESKRMNELAAARFEKERGLSSLGLRYFNVYGSRQDHRSDYAAVIPSWVKALLHNEKVIIYGDGETTRDFCFVGDVVRANVRAALADLLAAPERVVNVAAGRQTSLKSLFESLRQVLAVGNVSPEYRDFRAGDIRHSVADNRLAEKILGEVPAVGLEEGVKLSLDWYRKNLR